MLSTTHRTSAVQPATYKSRVTGFWDWFCANADRLYQTIEDGRCGDLEPEISAEMNRLFPNAAWVFGPGANGIGHSFTFTAEGDRARQLLTTYWRERAPALPGWTFHATKQRDPKAASGQLSFGEMTFNPLEFWLAVYVDEQDERFDLTIWHPAFPTMEERDRWTAISLFLDEALGELATQNWIGEIKISDRALAHSMPLTELPSFVDATVAKHDWELAIPGKMWSSYTYKEPESGVLRDDIIAGNTCLFELVQDTRDGHVEPDPVEGTGADFVYVTLPRTMLTPGKELDERASLEDEICAVLEPESGRLIGGATGHDHAYIDLLLYDGVSSIELLEQTLRKSRFGKVATIEFFAQTRASDRVVL